MAWWSDRYNRPMKDPLLLSYSIEELAYEYYLHMERRAAEAERLEAESDKIEEAKAKEAEAWADKMEAEENETSVDPALDPVNQKWMQEEIEKNKRELGEDFGEDLSLDFEDK